MVLGSACQVSFAFLNSPETRSLRQAREVTRDQEVFLVASPASWSALSFPNPLEWPPTHCISAYRPSKAGREPTILWMVLVWACPGPAPGWRARAMALVESEWTTKWLKALTWYQWIAASMAQTSASKAVCLLPKDLRPGSLGDRGAVLV